MTATSPVPVGGERGERPRATRLSDGAWLGGVATGLAAHLGWPVLLVRIGFVLLAAWQFLGVFLYGLLWLVLPSAPPAEQAPGIEAASRQGLRVASKPGRGREASSLVALLLLAAGLLWLVQSSGMGWAETYFWPFSFASVGIALVWRELDHLSGRAGRRRRGLDVWPRLLRGLVGLLLLGVGIFLAVAAQTGLQELPRILSLSGFAILGAVLLVAPWAYQTREQLARARERQLVADARADIAAHLHDSVLQTLASIQRQADDPKAVAALARRQERELRDWLYGQSAEEGTFRPALAKAADEIEAERGVPIDVVSVGDTHLDEGLDALVRAAREAMLNAAKHSGADKVDVYAEVADDSVEVFVRDRGVGFDPASVGEDRLGVRRSIVDRVERHGGNVRIHSAPGEGTEVRLEMKR